LRYLVKQKPKATVSLVVYVCVLAQNNLTASGLIFLKTFYS